MSYSVRSPEPGGCLGSVAPAPARDAMPVSWWPTVLAPRADGLYVIGLTGSGERESARRRIRDALRDAIGQLYGVPPGEIMIQFLPGVSPAVSFPGRADVQAPGISISHDGDVSLAAIHLHGPVGVDVMQVQEIDDWRAVARDYLGAAVVSEIEAVPSRQRGPALARAWTEHEARLKCHGRQLAEWTGTALPAQCCPLDLPAPFAGTVAIRVASQ